MSIETRLRADLEGLFSAAVAAVDPARLVRGRIREGTERRQLLRDDGTLADLPRPASLYVVGAGKGAGRLAWGLEEILGDEISRGLVVVPEGHQTPRLRRTQVVRGGHPLPTAESLASTGRLWRILRWAGRRDLVFFCLT